MVHMGDDGDIAEVRANNSAGGRVLSPGGVPGDEIELCIDGKYLVT
jgi:hypothetical protein